MQSQQVDEQVQVEPIKKKPLFAVDWYSNQLDKGTVAIFYRENSHGVGLYYPSPANEARLARVITHRFKNNPESLEPITYRLGWKITDCK